MANFFAGLTVGILIMVALFIIEAYLVSRQQTPLQKVARKLEQLTRAPGSILEPKRDEVVEFEEMIKRNDAEGKDTIIE